MKWAQRPGLVNGPGRPSFEPRSSGITRVEPCSWSEAGNSAWGIGGVAPEAIGSAAWLYSKIRTSSVSDSGTIEASAKACGFDIAREAPRVEKSRTFSLKYGGRSILQQGDQDRPAVQPDRMEPESDRLADR